jgi:hypothetical protein
VDGYAESYFHQNLMADGHPNQEVPAAAFGVGLGLCGLGALLFGAGTVVEYNNYKKAKKVYKQAKESELESVTGALGTAARGKRTALVQGSIKGQIQTDKMLPVATIKYNRVLDLSQSGTSTNRLDQSCSMFELTDAQGKIMVHPSSKTRVLHLAHKKETNYPWYVSTVSLLAGMGFVLGDDEYIAYDGDAITIFGKLRFNTARAGATFKPSYMSSNGPIDIIEAIEKDTGISGTIASGVLFAACVGLGIYCGYKLRSRLRDEH